MFEHTWKKTIFTEVWMMKANWKDHSWFWISLNILKRAANLFFTVEWTAALPQTLTQLPYQVGWSLVCNERGCVCSSSLPWSSVPHAGSVTLWPLPLASSLRICMNTLRVPLNPPGRTEGLFLTELTVASENPACCLGLMHQALVFVSVLMKCSPFSLPDNGTHNEC